MILSVYREEWDELLNETRAMKKLKRGKITQEEFEEQVGERKLDESDDDMIEEEEKKENNGNNDDSDFDDLDAPLSKKQRRKQRQAAARQQESSNKASNKSSAKPTITTTKPNKPAAAAKSDWVADKATNIQPVNSDDAFLKVDLGIKKNKKKAAVKADSESDISDFEDELKQ